MTNIVANSFTTYQLTDEEMLVGSVLTIQQREVLQNLLSVNAEEMLTLDYDVDKPLSFVQQQGYKRGWIDCLKYILDASQSAIELNQQPQQPE